jgi:hypothetical protein
MDAGVNDMDTCANDHAKPEAISGSQTDPSLPASDSDETEAPGIPRARFWGLCVGYVPSSLVMTCC